MHTKPDLRVDFPACMISVPARWSRTLSRSANMKFPTQSLFGLTLIAGLACGWYADRHRLNGMVRDLAEREDVARGTGSLYGRVSSLTMAARGYETNPESIKWYIDAETIPLVSELHQCINELDIYFGDGTAKDCAARALKHLKCEDADSFFRKAAADLGTDKWPEFEKGTYEYDRLKAFVEECLGE